MLDIDAPAASERTVPAMEPGSSLAFTIATLVTRPDEYAEMKSSFARAGFDAADCEYLMIDNTGDAQLDAFTGLNLALDMARGKIVILCHQDVRLDFDDRAVLSARLADLDARDPSWAIAGNAGGLAPGRLALRITDPHTSDIRLGPFPAQSQSVDENFIVVRRASGIRFSSDLSGFHLYGADLCLNARVRGFSSYVIDFHLRHLSGGTKDARFWDAERAFMAKWNSALRPHWLQTTCTVMPLGGGRLRQSFGRCVKRAALSLSWRTHRARLKAAMAATAAPETDGQAEAERDGR